MVVRRHPGRVFSELLVRTREVCEGSPECVSEHLSTSDGVRRCVRVRVESPEGARCGDKVATSGDGLEVGVRHRPPMVPRVRARGTIFGTTGERPRSDSPSPASPRASSHRPALPRRRAAEDTHVLVRWEAQRVVQAVNAEGARAAQGECSIPLPPEEVGDVRSAACRIGHPLGPSHGHVERERACVDEVGGIVERLERLVLVKPSPTLARCVANERRPRRRRSCADHAPMKLQRRLRVNDVSPVRAPLSRYSEARCVA